MEKACIRLFLSQLYSVIRKTCVSYTFIHFSSKINVQTCPTCVAIRMNVRVLNRKAQNMHLHRFFIKSGNTNKCWRGHWTQHLTIKWVGTKGLECWLLYALPVLHITPPQSHLNQVFHQWETEKRREPRELWGYQGK